MEPTRFSAPNDDLIMALTDVQRERFWRKVDKGEACWEWTAARATNGYGTWTIALGGGRCASLRPHRVAYVLTVGPIPLDRPQLDHLCRNQVCVNPAHLEPVTQSQNQLRIPREKLPTRGASIRPRATRDGRITYSVLFRADGKQRSRTFATQAEAETMAALIRAESVTALGA